MIKEFHKIQGQLGLESAKLVWATSKIISQTEKTVKQTHIDHEQKSENKSILLNIFIIIV